jgi:hypothetical protein
MIYSVIVNYNSANDVHFELIDARYDPGPRAMKNEPPEEKKT